MKKYLIWIGIVCLFVSCGGSQQASNSLQNGDYHKAFDIALTKIKKGKNKSSAQKNVPVLKEAYDKSLEKDKQELLQLKKNPSIANLTTSYKILSLLDVRHSQVAALEPLYYEGKPYPFHLQDHSAEIKAAKDKLAHNLYTSSKTLLQSASKEDAKKAYKHLDELLYIYPEYKRDIEDLSKKAKEKGSNYVLVQLNNKISQHLQDSTSRSELKQFATINNSNFDNPWLIFHQQRKPGVQYDYIATYSLNQYIASPEKTNNQKVAQKKQVQDGWNYQYDDKGNVKKDADGNDMKTPKYKEVTADIEVFQQVKTTTIKGELSIKNTKSNKIVKKEAIDGEAKLENVYATYKGDQRAIDQKYYQALQNKKGTFPPDDAFHKYALEIIKQKGMQHLNQLQF